MQRERIDNEMERKIVFNVFYSINANVIRHFHYVHNSRTGNY